MVEIEAWAEFADSRENDKFIDLFGKADKIVSVDKVTSKTTIDLTYTMQHMVVFGVLKKLAEASGGDGKPRLLDVGSHMGIVAALTSLYDVFYTDPRVPSYVIQHREAFLQTLPCEAQHLPSEKETFDIVTSFHAIEHFGLGRYGDTPDYYGDQKGLIEFNRVLKKGGQLVVSVPCRSESRIKFNDSREYGPRDFDKILESAGFKIASSGIHFHPYAREDGKLVTKDLSELDSYPIDHTAPVYIVHAYKPL